MPTLAVIAIPLALLTAAAVFSRRAEPFERLHQLAALVAFVLRGRQPTDGPPLPLRSTGQVVTIGEVRWVGPNGEVVDVIRLRGKDGVTHELYRLRRHGRFVANCRSLEQLAEHVDVAGLREET
jgi:hypothetical protein